MPRFFYFLALFLTLSCARAPRQALWQCVEMDGDSSLTVSDSLAKIAYDYYSRQGSARNRMMATYYLGQAEYDAGKNLPATLHFKQAYDLATQLDDPSFRGFSCQRLSRLYAQSYDNAQSAYYAQQAIPLLERCGDTLSANFSRIDLAERYIAQGKYALAEAITDSLLNRGAGHWLLEYYALLTQANLHFYLNDFDAAESYYQRLADIADWTPDVFGRLALIAEHQGKRFQADSLMALAADRMVDSADSVSFFANKEQISLLRGNYQAAYENQHQTDLIQDRLIHDILSRSVTHSMQTYFEQEYQAEKAKRKNLNIIFFLSVLLFSGAIGITLIALRRRKEQIVAQMAQMEILTHEFEQIQEGHLGARSIISTLVQDRINTMSQLANTYLSWSDEAVYLRENRQGKMPKEEMISEFRKELRCLRDDEHFIPSIEEALNHSHNDIITRIRQDCQGVRNGEIRVNEKDFQLLVLFFAGFSDKSVAFMLEMSDDALRTRKKNLRKVLLSLDNEQGKECLNLLSRKGHKTATNQ